MGATKSRGPQPGDELAALDRLGAEGDGPVPQLARQVVVVALEAPTRDAELASQIVQLVIGHIAHEMAPEPTAKGPDGRVDQHRHHPMVPHDKIATMSDLLLRARARVLHDLTARGLDSASVVSVVDEVVTARTWWVQEWPAGEVYLAALVAQDVQEALAEKSLSGHWPLCHLDHAAADHPVGDLTADGEPPPHEMRVVPDLGEDPHWVCEEAGIVVASVGGLLAG